MTIEQRKKNLLKKIKKLGILDIHFDGGNCNTLEAYESTVEIVEKHNKEYPPEYEAAHIKFIENVREKVWEKEKRFHGFYFEIAQIVFWGLKSMRYKPDVCAGICEKILDIEKLHKIYTAEFTATLPK